MNYILSVIILIIIYSLLSAGLNLIMGFGGIFNMGHGGFFAVGAYAGALIYTHLQMPFFAELLLAGLIAALFGLLLSLTAIRLKGDYITFSTFGFAIVIHTIANNWVAVTNGPVGIAGLMRPVIFGIPLNSLWRYMILCLVICAACLLIIYRIVRSPYGESIEAMREDETAAYASGIDVVAVRVQIFCTGAFFAGIAGVLFIHYLMLCDPTSFTFSTSSLLVCMVIIGGMGSIKGSIAGVVLVIGLPQILSFVGLPGAYAREQAQNIIYSLVLILIVITRPQGMFGKLKF